MAKIILHLEGSSKEFPVEGELTIGRHASCSIFVEEPKASRRHARITQKSGVFELEDLESSNGTRVNGKKITTHTLAHGDTIQIGATRLVFDAPELAAKTPNGKSADAPAKAKRSTDDPLVGTTLGGFKILARIGQGGMGTVYEALQISLERNVAVKVLKAELARDRGFAKEFIHEARSAGKFQHAGLVEIHDVNESQGVLYYAMELVDGESAMEKLKRKGKLELVQALDISIGVADVLVQLEKEDAVHQDIKPHNILLLKDGKIKLTDFGLATVDGRIRRIVADPDSILGTPYYMSPEQASRAKRITTKADIYGLGCTLFHLLTGKVPFEGNSAMVVLAKHANQTRPDAHEQDAGVPEVLADLLKQMMAIEPDERPESAQDVLDALKRVKTGLARTAGVQPIRPGPSGGSRRRTTDEARPPSPLSKMDPVAARVVHIGVIAVMLVLGFQVARVAVASLDTGGGRQPSPPTPTDGTRKSAGGTNVTPGNRVANVKGGARKDGKTGENKNVEEIPPEIEEAYKAALEKRDRALLSGNFRGALTTISDFRRAYPDGEISKRALQAFEETQKEIEGICTQILGEAEAAAEKKTYRIATAKCTRLISSADPRSTFADRARALMSRIDQETQARFEQARAAARKAIEQAKLPEASRAINAALDDLGGTKWSETLLADQLHFIMAGKFLKTMETAREAIATQGKPVNILVPNLEGAKKLGVLRQINELTLKTDLGGATIPYSLDKMTPTEIRQLLAQLSLSDQHVGLSNLFSILNQQAEAQKELEAALKIPEQAQQMERLAMSQAGVANLRRYDFSKWEHQSDWEAPSGAWSTKDDQYVLESVDGGDTILKPEAIGGPFPARKAHIAFDFTPGKHNEGYYISAEFGNDQKNIALVFTSTGWELQIAADDRQKARGQWSIEATKVELAIDDKDTLTLTLNGKSETPIAAKGLSALQGTLSFHAREAACAFDNIVLRTQE
jgi:serine/threonine protein kinase